jgi:hypothetical protein
MDVLIDHWHMILYIVAGASGQGGTLVDVLLAGLIWDGVGKKVA